MAVQRRKNGKVKVHQKHDTADSVKIKMTPNTKKKRRESVESRNLKHSVRPKVKPKRKLEVFEGGITARKRSRLLTAVGVLAVIAVIILHIVSPTGLLESAQNALVSIGSGQGMPVALSGDVVNYLNMRGSTAFVLTDSYMYAYNQAGKEITAVQHGYTSPVLDVSAARTLLYDRGNFRLRIDNLYKNISDIEFENEIISADLSDCGYTAVVLNDDEYIGVVTVYDKGFNPLLKWSSASEQIVCAKLSPNGKKLSVVTAASNNGNATSNIRIFDVKSGTQLATDSVNGTVLVTSFCNSKRVFFASPDKLVSYKWDGTERLDYDNLQNISLINSDNKDRVLVVCNPLSSREYTVAVLKQNGEKQCEFNVDTEYKAMCVSKNRVFGYNNGSVTAYDFEGKVAETYDTGYGSVRLAAYRRGFLATTDMKLRRFE